MLERKRMEFGKIIFILVGVLVICLAMPYIYQVISFDGSSGLSLAAAKKPSKPKDGDERYNWDTKKYQYYDGENQEWVDYDEGEQGPPPKKRGKFDVGKETGETGEAAEEGAKPAKQSETASLGRINIRINIFEILKKSFTLVILLFCSSLYLLWGG